MFNMLGTVLKVLNDTGIEYNLSGLVTQMLDTMLRQGNMQNLRGQLLDAITNICHQIEINQESGNIQLRLQILQYLEEKLYGFEPILSAPGGFVSPVRTVSEPIF